MSKVITGLEKVCIIGVDSSNVPDFGDMYWLDTILEDGSYSKEPYSKPKGNGALESAGHKHVFKFRSSDSDQCSSIETLSSSGTRCWVFGYGIGDCIVWRQPAEILVEKHVENKAGELLYFDVTCTIAGVDGVSDIKDGNNLLRPTLSDGTLSTAKFTTTTGALTAGATPNAGFTTATGTCFRLVNTPGSTGTSYPIVSPYENMFPAKVGMTFSFYADCYWFGSGTSSSADLRLVEYDSGLALEATTTNALVKTTVTRFDANDPLQVTISDVDTILITIGASVTASGTPDSIEFDNLALFYGGYRAYTEN